MLKKVLIITYYWPPSGGGGVQRWAKMAKYFEGFGWEPIVYIPENPDYPIIDHSFDEDVKEIKVLKGSIIEPSRILKKLGREKEANLNSGFVVKKDSFSQRLAIAIRGNFFIPDARKLWIKPSVKTLSKWLSKNEVDAIISTGPPHSCHIIAMQLKKMHGTPWISDFRDPWTNIDFYKDLRLSKWADKKHRKQEREVLENSSLVVGVGKTLTQELNDLGAKRTAVVSNGYDKIIEGTSLDFKFSLLHIGRLGKSRNPKVLWKVISELSKEVDGFSEDCVVNLVGNVDGEINDSTSNFGISKNICFHDGVSNMESLKLQSKSQVLLLLINDTPNAKGILTGKFFEYLSVGRPILCLGPKNGDAAELLKETKAGTIFSFTEERELKNELLSMYQKYKQENLFLKEKNIESYSRKNLAQQYVVHLNSLVNG